MAIVKMSEFRSQTDEQLVMSLRDLEKSLFTLRFESSTDRLESPSEIRKARRDIARIKTLQREREIVRELETLATAALAAAAAAVAPKPKPVTPPVVATAAKPTPAVKGKK